MAGEPTLATAWIGLMPTMAGMQGNIEKELSSVDVEGAGKKAGSKFGKVLAGAAVAGIGSVIAGAAAVLKTGFQEAMDASAGNAQLAAGIKSTGNAANVSVKGLNDLASSIQGMSGQTDDSIVAAEGLLLTFTNIKNSKTDKIFDDATLAAANMAAKMGGDASSQAVLLGKALNDPVKGISALTRVGVSFTDGQKATIKSMVEAGDVAGAQKIILKELNTEFGGAAEAAGKSLPGQMEIMKRSFEDVSQSIAEKLIPIVLPALKGIADVVTKRILPAVDRFIAGFKSGEGIGGKFRDVFERVRSVLGDVGKYVTGTVIPAVQTLGQWIMRNKDWLAALVVTIGTALVIWKTYTTAMALWKAAQLAAIAVQAAWNVVMAANPIGIIIVAIAALVAGLVFFFTKTEMGKKIWQGFTDFLVAAWDWITVAAKNVWAFLKKVWGWSPLGIIVQNWDKIVAGFKAYIALVRGYFQGIWDFIKKVWGFSPLGLIVTNWDKIMAFFKGIPAKLKAGFSKVTEFITAPFKSAFNAIAGFWNSTVGKLSFKAPSWVPGIGGKGWDVPDIPYLADGGTALGSGWSVVGERGPELRYMPRGASIVPLDHPASAAALGGHAGNTFNIYEAVDAHATAMAVARRQALAAA
jgi:hypothetical protein